MTKFKYSCDKDKEVFIQSYRNISHLLFGKNNSDKSKLFLDGFDLMVKEVNFYSQGEETAYLKGDVNGKCRLDESDGKLIIDVHGFDNSNPSQYDSIRHNITHELVHAFADILPMFYATHLNGIVEDGILCKNHMGMVKETDIATGKSIEPGLYHKMFNETMMDIVAGLANNVFNCPPGMSADVILNTPHSEHKNADTVYSIYTSLTKLTIAAFSNNPDIDYQNYINQGESISRLTIPMKNGKKYIANDFLYGIMFDPLHIQENFDLYLEKGRWKEFCKALDAFFLKSKKDQKVTSEVAKLVMTHLAEFLNQRMSYYERYGLIDRASARKIKWNFNMLFNKLQDEYRTFFTQNDVNQIAIRSGIGQ